jgi:hypothetical protein
MTVNQEILALEQMNSTNTCLPLFTSLSNIQESPIPSLVVGVNWLFFRVRELLLSPRSAIHYESQAHVFHANISMKTSFPISLT